MTRLKARPNFSVDDLKGHFKQYSREPFIDILAYFVGCSPDPVALQDFANSHPDKWASAISTFAKLSGFTEKTEIVGNINIQIEQMGDAQLMERLEKVKQDMIDLDQGEYSVIEAEEEAPTE